MSKRDYGFHLGQTVNVIEAGIRAKIDAVMDSLDGVQYRICFWNDSVRRIEWVYPNEIQSLQKEPMVESYSNRR